LLPLMTTLTIVVRARGLTRESVVRGAEPQAPAPSVVRGADPQAPAPVAIAKSRQSVPRILMSVHEKTLNWMDVATVFISVRDKRNAWALWLRSRTFVRAEASQLAGDIDAA
jgi:hypothetical protein